MIKSGEIVFISVALLSFFMPFVCGATLFPAEVEALKEIAQTLGKRDWNFSVDPCSRQAGWTTVNPALGSENVVACDCSDANGTICHVVTIILNSQSLPGVLPPELVKLPYLQELSLARNYLNGSIPKEWGSMRLTNISLTGNRLSSSIPVELTNITTLRVLMLEFNQMSGVLPPELGNLTNMESILLSSNFFTGPLPETLVKLTKMKDFRINDNKFTGKIPNFIQNWTNLETIRIQASGLQGPIPSGISLLTQISDMRISDLNGTEIAFPPLSNMKNMDKLILSNCGITGALPAYIGTMTLLQILDLSFNKLTGPIPSSFDSLRTVNYIFLTGNALTGSVPEWMIKGGNNIDLSYNNFTLESSNAPNCQQQNVNLFGSSSLGNNSNGIVPCLKSLQCPQNTYSFHINCGDAEVTSGGILYEEDVGLSAGASTFFMSKYNWAFSSTGKYLDNTNTVDYYIRRNTSRLLMEDYSLYLTARVSPLSLTYYGYCLLNGNYTVKLHFAEIIFTNDKTYGSLGRRLFDIYIQGKLVLQDFNIEQEAGGVGKAVVKNFTALVTGTTLEIRFHWVGKGTTEIPSSGVYGPLVSAISVDPDFKPPLEGGKKTSPGIVVGIVLAVSSLVVIILAVLWWKGCFGRKDGIDQELRGLDLKTRIFTLRHITDATDDFNSENKIGEGGFGPVFKGCLSDGTMIAVKQLSSKSNQGNREFVNEIGLISALRHPNLVRLYGCCIEGNQLLLVYEYMENNSLARALFGGQKHQLNLAWQTRCKICIGIARALAYLHEESRLKVVHRDIKATNVLLDKDLNPKVSDFGLAKLDEGEKTHTRIAGTFGYMAPEYAMKGQLTDKVDVYSFGVVVLEIVSGKSNGSSEVNEDGLCLLDWAIDLQENGNLMDLVDPSLESNYITEEVLRTINVALLCTHTNPASRPTMSSVLSVLEGRTVVQEIVYNLRNSSSMHRDAVDRDQSMNNSDQSDTVSMYAPLTGSSTPMSDLYSINLDTQG